MIKNERQYRITRAEADRFRLALRQMADAERDSAREEVHPRLLQAQREGLKSQLKDLLREIQDYEDLKSGKVSVIHLDTLDALPEGLIRARIATGLTHKTLAERLGMNEQQVQRYEAEGYASASLTRLSEVARAIGVRVREDIELPPRDPTFDRFFQRLGEAGLQREFVLSRLLPDPVAAQVEADDYEDDAAMLLREAAASVERVFGWGPGELFGAAPLAPPREAVTMARFKMPARRASKAISAYATYARYLALVVTEASGALPRERLPTEPGEVRRAIVERHGSLTLEAATEFCWDLGVPVLPLRDSGTFHGACWRHCGRNVIVLKQRSAFSSRWLFDLLHEYDHAKRRPKAEELEVVEGDETSEERRNSPEEIAASRFAGDVALDGRAEKLAEACVVRAKGNLRNLKRAVVEVATQDDLSVGLLANYLAYRLSWQGENWWGAAANLQEPGADPWHTVREVFLRRFSFGSVPEADARLLQQALA
ncbi:MAG TPA: helix-turn-helix domain-containing protein [Stellaceae bacterium]|nr:helix-turn-helix domain-containing protein [Stellaceae bacterium]